MRVVAILFTIHYSLFVSEAQAQPKARRQQTQQKAGQKQTQQNQGMSMRARLMFPTAIDMPEDVVWRRDIYREIDLNKDANGGLYYPVEPMDREVNLFTYIFKLALNNYIPVYEYRLDGNESFSDSARVQMKTVLDNYHIYYQEKDGKLRVENSDIPSAEVKLYYLKESAYYDQANSSFHIKVLALCPIMYDKDFGPEPLFWVKYADLEPFLSRQTIMTSNVNNAAVMSLDDYFTLNKYDGKIYKTNNMLGKTLTQMVDGDPELLSAEQKRIEDELEAFRNNIFGDKAKRDSLDSIANNHPQNLKAAAKAKKASAAKVPKAKKEKASRSSSSASSAASPAARVSVRRQRH